MNKNNIKKMSQLVYLYKSKNNNENKKIYNFDKNNKNLFFIFPSNLFLILFPIFNSLKLLYLLSNINNFVSPEKHFGAEAANKALAEFVEKVDI